MPREVDLPRPSRTENVTIQGKAPVPGVDRRVDAGNRGKTNDAAVLAASTAGATFPFTRMEALEDAISTCWRRGGRDFTGRFAGTFRVRVSAQRWRSRMSR